MISAVINPQRTHFWSGMPCCLRRSTQQQHWRECCWAASSGLMWRFMPQCDSQCKAGGDDQQAIAYAALAVDIQLQLTMQASLAAATKHVCQSEALEVVLLAYAVLGTYNCAALSSNGCAAGVADGSDGGGPNLARQLDKDMTTAQQRAAFKSQSKSAPMSWRCTCICVSSYCKRSCTTTHQQPPRPDLPHCHTQHHLIHHNH